MTSGDDGSRASRPSGQVFQNGKQFDDEGWQEQNMKTEDPTEQNHRHAINGLINKRPAERSKDQLQPVRRHGSGQRE